MALRLPPRPWKCPQCRTFSISTRRRQLGPEHPRFIDVPEPPQPNLPARPFIKGRLPVPRNVFAGAGNRDKATDQWVQQHTQEPANPPQHPPGSREAWKARMSEMRRRNLREGLASLRVRRRREETMLTERGRRNQAEREAALYAPEREDERLTTPSHGLDLEELLKSKSQYLADPNRAERIARMRANVAAHASQKREERFAALNTLYQHARTFIVTPQQLDNAIEEAFGTDENPKIFQGDPRSANSVWAYGQPERVQDMLNRINNAAGSTFNEAAKTPTEVNMERMKRLAEVLTGGRLIERPRETEKPRNDNEW